MAYGSDPSHEYFTILFYKYLPFKHPEEFAREQEAMCNELKLRGRLLISAEGINGTLASSGKAAIEEYVARMRADNRFSDIDWKGSSAGVQPFPDLHVRVVAEIISTGGKVLPPHAPGAPQPGERLRPEDFDALLRHVLEEKMSSDDGAGAKRPGQIGSMHGGCLKRPRIDDIEPKAAGAVATTAAGNS